MNEAMDRVILLIQGLSFQIYDERGLLEDGGIEDITLVTR